MEEPERMTIEEAAAAFDVPPDMLRKACQRGTLPASKVGTGRHSLWLLRPADVAEYTRTRQPRRRRPSA